MTEADIIEMATPAVVAAIVVVYMWLKRRRKAKTPAQEAA